MQASGALFGFVRAVPVWHGLFCVGTHRFAPENFLIVVVLLASSAHFVRKSGSSSKSRAKSSAISSTLTGLERTELGLRRG